MDNELYHYGVKGMKWGVRKSRSSSGKKRGKTYGWSKDAKRANAIKKKSVKQMSNAELQALNKRMELENNYNRLNPSKVKKGLLIAGAIAGGLGTINSLYSNGSNLIKNGKKAYDALKHFK